MNIKDLCALKQAGFSYDEITDIIEREKPTPVEPTPVEPTPASVEPEPVDDRVAELEKQLAEAQAQNVKAPVQEEPEDTFADLIDMFS